ncbi:MAG TPA: glycosyltransferase [Candidatus Paceibacterota bacterium]|nr:glycosyltransferase [Candidatus Paceibacterota bacterium]
MRSSPVVSIIIPTLKEGAFLERTLKQFDTLSLPHEIIITDGGSTDETLPIARRYTEKIVVWGEPRRQTFGEAKNAGARQAQGDYLVFIDADVLIPEPNAFFEEMLAAFGRDPRLVAMTVPLTPWPENRSLVDALFCKPLNWAYIIANNVFGSGNSSGEFQMVRTDAFRKEGGFKEALAAGEDNELFRELANHGRTLSYWKLSVQHSLRRPHKLGWLRVYASWIKNGLSVMIRGKAAYKEWAVVR